MTNVPSTYESHSKFVHILWLVTQYCLLFVRNSEDFIEIQNKFKVQGADKLVRYNTVGTFTTVPKVIRKKQP
jgi:hypothetical protein